LVATKAAEAVGPGGVDAQAVSTKAAASNEMGLIMRVSKG
jgi:hypothetical protein